MGYPSRASEFPNDNAEISAGAIWVCAEVTGPAVVETAPYEPVPSERFVLYFDDDDHVDGPVDLEITAGNLSIASAPDNLPVPTSEECHAHAGTDESETSAAFAQFERALTTALLAQGATRAAALLPLLLRLEPLPAETLTKDLQLTLQSRGYLESNARYSQKYRDLCSAWTALLRGSSQDFAACGTTTLDRFGADLLAALLTVPTTRSDDLRRELRKAGIAAFGVLQAA